MYLLNTNVEQKAHLVFSRKIQQLFSEIIIQIMSRKHSKQIFDLSSISQTWYKASRSGMKLRNP